MRIGLVMIVRDEEAVIARALTSARPFINTWLIVDTGSTDRTKEIIRESLADISGELHDRPWRDFGTNRTELLRLADSRMDWAIMLDADDNLAGIPPPPPLWESTDLDAIAMRVQHGQIWHNRIHIFRTAGRNWCYEGIIHEQPVCTGKATPIIGMLPSSTYMVSRCEGFRSRNPNKYADDAVLLEREVLRRPNDARTLFYLAQSYRDAGNTAAAILNYRRYLALPDTVTPVQERYIVLLNIIQLLAADKSPAAATESLSLAWQAVELCPDRCEVPFVVLRNHRQNGQKPTQQLYALAATVVNRSVKGDMMYLNPAIYEWGMDDELVIAAAATGHWQTAYDASMRCAMSAPVAEMRLNALQNAKLAAANRGEST